MDGDDPRSGVREWWGKGPTHATAWRASQNAGWRAYRYWREDGMPEKDCVEAAIAAGLMAYMAVPIISRTTCRDTPESP